MPEEIAKCEWIPVAKMKHFTFTNAAKNICSLLQNEAKVKSGKIDLRNMPIGDLFRDSGFAIQDYKLMGADFKMYSSEYMNKLSSFFKERRAKL